ncbi:uncharacterized protein [Amphiura filiformis]|uniref:uncharacterized protein n=1 Tax=Amphiura filiformis TaxID=82378 RepID=UPI003B228D93
MASGEDESYLIDKSDVTYGEAIGKGAFGTVFKVTLRSAEGSTEAAAKKVASTTQSDEELKFMSTLRHKNVITFFGFIRDKTELTIITELAAKGDLQKFLQSSTEPLPIYLVKKWTKEAAEGIQYLHQQKTAHKDVKSSNFLITSDDVLKLCDFGTVGSLDKTMKTEHRKGTIRWMAPEVIEKEIRSAKSDVYSYGTVTWEICTRDTPFAKLQTRAEIMDAVTEGQRPKIPRDCPVVLRKIMQSCWKYDHTERPSMDEVMEMLESDQWEDDKDSEEESDEEDIPDHYKFFEKTLDTMQNMQRQEHVRQDKNKEMMDLSRNAYGKFKATQTKKAEEMKQSVERMTGKQVFGDRLKILKEKQAKLLDEKERMKQGMISVKSKLTDNKKLENMLETANQSVLAVAKQHTDQMFQACYKSDDWDADDLKSFTRMSTMQANIPDVIGDFVGEVKHYKEPQTTSDVFQLSSIPSREVLSRWKEVIGSQKSVGDCCYIEAGEKRFDLDSIEQILVVHRVLDVKREVKLDVVWFMIPPFFPTLVERRPGSIKVFQNLVLHEKHDQIIEGYDMDPMDLSKICRDHSLTYRHIQLFLIRLNDQQSDVFCLYPQSEDDTQQNLCKLLEDGKEKPSSLVFIFHVRRSEQEVVLGDEEHPGSHFTLCHVNCLTNKVIYADSLGWPAPTKVRETIAFYYQCIYGHSVPDFDVKLCHEPASSSVDITHTCCHQCATYYPLQTSDSICGVVVIIIASVACIDTNLFQFLTTVQRYNNHPVMSHFQNPTEFSKYLRFVLATWLEEKRIDVNFVTPKNLSKYQLVNSFHPSFVSELDFSPFHPLLVPTPGLINLLLPDSQEGTQKEDLDTNVQSTNQNRQGKTTMHWIGSKLEDMDDQTMESCSRIDSLRFRLPGVSKVKNGNIVICEDDEGKHMTSVFQQSEIPDQQTLTSWQDQLMESVDTIPTGRKAYVEADEVRYDIDAIGSAFNLHRVRNTKSDVEEELEWFEGYQVKPLADMKMPNRKSFRLFRNLIHGHKHDTILKNYNMDAQELSQICCNRQISGKHVQWIVDKLNSMQSKVICIYGNVAETMTSSTVVRSDEASYPSIVMVSHVFKSNGLTRFSDEDLPECHFTLCYVDVKSKKIIYGDSYGWPAPDDLQENVAAKYTNIFDSPLPRMEIVMCHDTTFNTASCQHICSPLCATYYSLQSCDVLSGVVCSIIAVIACLAPDYFEFLTVPQYNKIFTGTFAFHLQYPSMHTNYLRRVLAAWFTDMNIDVDHVVPEGFDKYKQLAVPGSQSAPAGLAMGSMGSGLGLGAAFGSLGL